MLGPSGFFLVLLLSSAARIYAEDRSSNRPVDQTKEEETITTNEQPMRRETTPNTAGMVGPSGEEIHDFLYPTYEDEKLLTRAN